MTRPDAEFRRRSKAAHVQAFKHKVGSGAMIIEGQEISAVVAYIEALEAKVNITFSSIEEWEAYYFPNPVEPLEEPLQLKSHTFDRSDQEIPEEDWGSSTFKGDRDSW